MMPNADSVQFQLFLSPDQVVDNGCARERHQLASRFVEFEGLACQKQERTGCRPKH